MPPKSDQPEFEKIPAHVAIIMDGNGRWAESRHLPRMAGHRAGTENLRTIIKACVEFGISYLTIYAFSTENWRRSKDEVDGLMQIIGEVIERELAELHKQGVQLRHIGRLEGLDEGLKTKIIRAMEMTRDNQRLVLCIAWNYGGRDEITYAVQRMLGDKLDPGSVSEETIENYLFTAGIPDPDLVIRTSGEMRTSNYLIWQSAYSEWYFTPVLWPDFDKEALRQAILDFGRRERRYGGRKAESEKKRYAG